MVLAAMAAEQLAALALLPLAVVAVFLVMLRWPASIVMPMSFLTAAGLSIWVWETPSIQVAAASVRGLLIAATLLYIILAPFCC